MLPGSWDHACKTNHQGDQAYQNRTEGTRVERERQRTTTQDARVRDGRLKAPGHPKLWPLVDFSHKTQQLCVKRGLKHTASRFTRSVNASARKRHPRKGDKQYKRRDKLEKRNKTRARARGTYIESVVGEGGHAAGPGLHAGLVPGRGEGRARGHHRGRRRGLGFLAARRQLADGDERGVKAHDGHHHLGREQAARRTESEGGGARGRAVERKKRSESVRKPAEQENAAGIAAAACTTPGPSSSHRL